jgi:CHAT domain-containing protein
MWTMRLAVAAALLIAAMHLPSDAATSVPPDPNTIRAASYAAAQGVIISAATDGLSNMALRIGDGHDERSELARERMSLANDLAKTRRKLEAAYRQTSADRDLQLTRLNQEEQAIERRLTENGTKMDKDLPEYAELTRPRPLQVAETRGLLGSDEALLLIVPGPDATYIWVVTRENFEWARVPMTDMDLAAAVAELRDGLEPQPNGAVKPFDRKLAYALYQALIVPLEPLFRDKKLILTAVSGTLQSLPLSVLVTDPPLGDNVDPADLLTTHWLADRYALATLPAVSSLQVLRCYAAGAVPPATCPNRKAARPAPEASDPDFYAGFGDPQLLGPPDNRKGPDAAGKYSLGETADIEAIRRLPRLKDSASEVTALVPEFGRDKSFTRTEAEMTETAFKSSDEVRRAGVLLISTHGLLSTEAGAIGEPGLVFTPPAPGTPHAKLLQDDGLLTASEVTSLRLSAQIVVLSACNTARNDGKLGSDGLAGLARAFFFAGAHALLVSHWAVDSEASSALTIATIKTYRRDPGIRPASVDGKAGALQAAMQAVRQDPKHPQWAHPTYWAPFILVGDR